MDVEELADLGRKVVKEGWLRGMRRRLGLSASYTAELLGVSAITYRSWERNPDVRLWNETARKIGRFYQAVSDQIDELEVIGVEFRDLIPIQMAAPLLGVPQELLLRRYRDGEFDGVDLGILGLWLYRSVFHELKAAA